MKKLPSYCLHRPSGQAYVTLCEGGRPRVRYLGLHGSPESYQKYAAILNVLSQPHPAPSAPPSPQPLPQPAQSDSPTVAAAAALWASYCATYYRLPDGNPSTEIANHKLSWEPLTALFGSRSVASLSRRDFASVREEMIRRGWSRGVVTQRWGRILRGLRHLADEGLVEVSVLVAASLTPLPIGRSAAPETEPIRPVPLEAVRATQRELHPVVRDMVELQLLTGARPGEIRELRLGDLVGDGAGSGVGGGYPSAIRPRLHKMAYKGRPRLIPLSASARVIIRLYAAPLADPSEFLFSPRSAPRGANRKRRGYYTRYAYGTAIYRAADRAGVERWSPNQVRHLVGTLVRELLSLDDARSLLGHDDVSTTRIYAEENEDAPAARRAAEALERAVSGQADSGPQNSPR